MDMRSPSKDLIKPEVDSAKTDSKQNSSAPENQSHSEGIQHQMTDLAMARGISFPGPDHPLYDENRENSSDASSQHRMRLTNTGQVEIADLLTPPNAQEMGALIGSSKNGTVGDGLTDKNTVQQLSMLSPKTDD